jgi:anti-sigma regulatory factor (Ser/Thr protein kinase)
VEDAQERSTGPDLVCRPQAAAEARRAARVFIDGLSPQAGVRVAENLLLVVSELATNALRHAGGVLEMRLSSTPEHLLVAVDDPSPVPPGRRAPDLTGRTGGFGWAIVQQLADSLAVHPRRGGGKTVAAYLTR